MPLGSGSNRRGRLPLFSGMGGRRKRPRLLPVPRDAIFSADACEVHVLHVATDSIMKIYRRGLMRAGRATPPKIEIAVDRWAHAYRSNTEVTLCGLKIDRLHWRPFRTLDFTTVNSAFHFPRCSEAVTGR